MRAVAEPGRPATARPGSHARVARAPLASVLALQRSAGNAVTRRVLARSPRKPYQHQWENPALLETIYPAREVMLKKFVSIYRELELRDLTDPAARKQVIEQTRAAMQAEIDKLKALPEPSKQDQARIAELESVLKRGQASTDKAFEDAVSWERRNRADPLAGAALMTEVKRLFGSGSVPAWLQPMVLDYAGMRYKSAHNTYFSPVRLWFMLQRARGNWTKARETDTAAADEAYKKRVAEWEAKDPNPRKRGKAPAKPKAVKESAAERAALGMTPDEALAQIEKLHDAGEIPEWAWHKIVRLTELRTWYAEAGWEDDSKETPPPAADPALVKALKDWTGDEYIGGLSYGSTSWRSEIHRRNTLITTRMVCDQLSEATQRQRGVDLEGGISKNAQGYVDAAEAGAKPGAKKGITGAYFRRPEKLEDLRPGAALFWVENGEWAVKKPDGSNMVLAVADATYPMPVPPEYVAEWTTWRASDAGKAWAAADAAYKKDKRAWDQAKKTWDAKAAKAKTPDDKAKLPAAPVEPAKPTDTQPAYTERPVLPKDGEQVNGWTYAVKPGQPITRTKDGVTHWMTWKHQATVVRTMPDGRVFTFETVIEKVAGVEHHGAGFGVRSLGELQKPGIFVGYMPGEVDAPPAAPAAKPATLPIPDIIEDLIDLLDY
jgi:hypothetical protein